MNEILTKGDIIKKIQHKTGFKKVDISAVLNAFTYIIEESLKDGDIVRLTGFGTFRTKVRKSKLGRDLNTMELISIPAKEVPVFEAGSRLRRIVTRNIQ